MAERRETDISLHPVFFAIDGAAHRAAPTKSESHFAIPESSDMISS
jgi:hypothetical protein